MRLARAAPAIGALVARRREQRMEHLSDWNWRAGQ
jgi:hypothetical protein